MLQVHRVILILAQSQCNRNTTAVIVLYGLQEHEVQGFTCFHRCPRSALPSAFREMFPPPRRESKAIWHSRSVVFFLHLLTASVAFPLHSPITRCMSANLINEQLRSILHRYVTCFPSLRLFETDSRCNKNTVYKH